MTDFGRLLAALASHDVQYIIVGGFAATSRSAFLTVDLDVVYARTSANISRLVAALAPLSPYLRGAPPGLPFRLDVETVWHGLNFTLHTSAGDLDLLGEATGGGTYEALLSHSEVREVLGQACRFVDLETLIRLKRAAGRPRNPSASPNSRPFTASSIETTCERGPGRPTHPREVASRFASGSATAVSSRARWCRHSTAGRWRPSTWHAPRQSALASPPWTPPRPRSGDC